jgi:hypothetical protein
MAYDCSFFLKYGDRIVFAIAATAIIVTLMGAVSDELFFRWFFRKEQAGKAVA